MTEERHKKSRKVSMLTHLLSMASGGFSSAYLFTSRGGAIVASLLKRRTGALYSPPSAALKDGRKSLFCFSPKYSARYPDQRIYVRSPRIRNLGESS